MRPFRLFFHTAYFHVHLSIEPSRWDSGLLHWHKAASISKMCYFVLQSNRPPPRSEAASIAERLKLKYLRASAALNDQLCYFPFLRSQLRTAFENFTIADAGHLFLKSVFAKNRYSPKINVRIDQVQRFESEHERVTFGAYVTARF